LPKVYTRIFSVVWAKENTLMIRKILTLISFGCLWPGLGAAQQVQVQVTLQAPQADTTTPPRGPSTVSLEDLVREALQKNPAIQSALHSVEAQRRRVPQAKTLPDPMVGIGWAGNITPFSVQSATLPATVPSRPASNCSTPVSWNCAARLPQKRLMPGLQTWKRFAGA
jgi:hypothetical protein